MFRAGFFLDQLSESHGEESVPAAEEEEEPSLHDPLRPFVKIFRQPNGSGERGGETKNE